MEMFWRIVAWIVARPMIADWIIRRAMKTEYTHLPGYMNRYWLFNPYTKANGVEVTPIEWLPSIRVHHILRRDNDRHKHDHPWESRTIGLKRWYRESRVAAYGWRDGDYYEETVETIRGAGDTAPIRYGEYHSITDVPEGGVWTLFITFGYKGTWGFLVDGKKVDWRTYMEMYPEKPWASDTKTCERQWSKQVVYGHGPGFQTEIHATKEQRLLAAHNELLKLEAQGVIRQKMPDQWEVVDALAFHAYLDSMPES